LTLITILFFLLTPLSVLFFPWFRIIASAAVVVFIHCLVLVLQLRIPPHVVALQDVSFWRDLPPVVKPHKFYVPPPLPLYKPRVVTYVSKRFVTVVSALPWFFDRGNLMIINFPSENGLFESAFTVFRIYNTYSTIHPSTSQHTSIPEDLFPTHILPSLTVGNLNIHNYLSAPARLLSDSEFNVSSQYFELAVGRLYTLLHTPGVFTRFSFDTTTRSPLLDLSCANTALAPYIGPWNSSFTPTGSDHLAISIKLSAPTLKPAVETLNRMLKDWSSVESPLIEKVIPPPTGFQTAASLDSWFDKSLSSIT